VVLVVYHLTKGEHMLRVSRIVAVALLVLGLGLGCASTHFVSTWTDPSLDGPISLAGKKVATFLLSDEESTRRMVEEIMAGEVTSHGAEGIPGFSLMSSEEAMDQDWVKERLSAEGIEGAVIMRVTGRETETRYVAGSTYYAPAHYSSMWGYWGPSWSMVHDPGYLETDVIVSVETLVYSVTQDKLLWGGVSETFNPSDMHSFIIELSAVAADEMRKSGLLE
jgi:hypothetical protein